MSGIIKLCPALTYARNVPFSCRGVAQPGRAPGSGPGGRRFKSSLPDHSSERVESTPELARALADGIERLGLPVSPGRVWTTDAPYRETQQQLDAHAAEGV